MAARRASARLLRAALAVATVAAVIGAVSGQRAAAAAVPAPVVTVSPGAASATVATYSIDFTLDHALATGDAITLVAPPGLLWPSSQATCSYALTDITTPASGFSCAQNLRFTDPGIQVFDFLNASGSVVALTVPNDIAGGDHVVLAVTGVRNPAAGIHSLTITAQGGSPQPSSTFTLAPAGVVSNVTVTTSRPTASAAVASYDVGFTTGAHGAIPAGGAITLVAPAGTQWPSASCSYALTDATTPAASFPCAQATAFSDPGVLLANFLSPGGAIVTVTVPHTIGAGDALHLVATGVTPAAGTGQTLSAATSSDLTPVSSTPFDAVTPAAVSQPTVNVNPASAGSTATYTVTFTLTRSLATGELVTIAAPPGTVWPGNANSYTYDDTTAAATGAFNTAHVGGGGRIVSLTTPTGFTAGDALSLQVTSVTNPGAAPSNTLTVDTSADPLRAGSAAYAITGSAASPSSITGLGFATSSSAAQAEGVTDSFDFTATSTLPAGGTITVVAPPGTRFGACPYGCGGGNADYSIVDHTTPAGSGGVSVVVLDNGSVVDLGTSAPIQAGDSVTLTATQVMNPLAGAGQMSVATTADLSPAAVSAPSSAAGAVSGVALNRTSTAAHANGVTWSVDLTLSPTGGLAKLTSAITLTASPGTIFGRCPYGCGGGNASYSIVDHTANTTIPAYPAVAAGGASVGVIPTAAIAGGDQLTVTATQVTNPPAGTTGLTVSTSSDRRASTAGTTSPASAPANARILVGNLAESATDVTYSVEFNASPTGDIASALGSITIGGDIALVAANAFEVTITDFTTGTSLAPVSATVLPGGRGASVVPAQEISPGDLVVVAIHGVTNLPDSGPHLLTVSTSSDRARSTVDYTLAPGHAVSGLVTLHAGAVAQSAPIQACSTSVVCATAATGNDGHYSIQLIPGTYAVTALAPAGSTDRADTRTVVVASGPVAGVDLQLTAAAALHGGFTLTSPTFGTEDKTTDNPVLNWNEPTQLTVQRDQFPAKGTVIVTQVVVSGVNTLTGRSTTRQVDVGGSIGGVPLGQQVGTGPVTLTVPPLNPIHGPVSLSVNYQVYPDGDTSTGIRATQVLDLQYPSAPPSEGVTDPLPAYFVNVSAPSGIVLGPGTIVGTDADTFSIVPLSAIGVPAGSLDCGQGAVPLQQDTIEQSNPPPGTSCGVGVQFTPPTTPSKIYYYARLRMPVSTGGSHSVTLIGCDARIAAAAGFESCYQGTGGEVAPDADPNGSGGGGGNGGGGTSNGGGTYIDPSGTVLAKVGASPAVPVQGATVTLLRSVDGSPFAAVPNGSSVMSPDNRTNPATTSVSGTFGWDVLAGLYQVSASEAGCTTAHTPLLVIPPPALGLTLTMPCTSLPARSATAATLTVAPVHPSVGHPLTLKSHVTGAGSPSGVVHFLDGHTSLGSAALASGNAVLAVPLTVGTHRITAHYDGNAVNSASTSTAHVIAVERLVVAPARLPVAGLRLHYRHRLIVAGASGTPRWSVTRGRLPSGLRLTTSGVLTGTPTHRGAVTFTVSVVDGHGVSAARIYRLVIRPLTTLGGPAAVAHGQVAQLHGLAVPGSTVTIRTATPGHRLHTLGRTSADSVGAWHLKLQINRTAVFSASAAGATSPLFAVGTNPTLSAPAQVATGSAFALTGVARPGAVVTLTAARHGHAGKVVGTAVADARTGRFRFDVVALKGVVLYHATAQHLSSATRAVHGG